VDSRRRLGIPLRESCVRRFGAQLVVGALPARSLVGGPGRWKAELDEGRPEIEARAADDDRREPLLARSIAACASSAYSPTDASCSSSQILTSSLGCSDWFVRIGTPR
jgi:hypothetical protein